MNEPIQLSDDLNEFVAILASKKVEFVVIGAHAVAVHAKARMTEDFDIFVKAEAENVARLQEAIKEFGLLFPDSSVAAFLDGSKGVVTLGIAPNQIQILNFASGLEFDAARSRATLVGLNGVPTPFLSLPDLVANKRASNRPKDLFDLAMLREIHGVLPGDEAE
ncbi:MAG: nucleotidyl transferase AbiEii/AbiGii toxin family protein [Armatimonadetes bacterium]|nr:nucleotidyl transferase AbiEii/AbiGii toxin family protein [Armatimonadota bacterium]